MFKSITIAALAVFTATSFSQSANAGFYRYGDEPYALSYCNYYKTRAMFAGRKARAKPGVAKHRRKAIGLWKQYNYCLKDNGWPVQYRIPSYR